MQIRVNPDALRAAAEQQRTIGAAIDGALSTLQGISGELAGVWEGMGANSALTSLEEVKNGVGHATEIIEEGSQQLEGIAQMFESIDEGESPFIALRFDPARFVALKKIVAIPRAFFSTGVVRIDPDQVRALASSCNQVVQILDDAAGSYRTMVSSLSDNWEGNSHNKFVSEAEDVIVGVNNLREALQEIATRMRVAATRYEELDNSL